MPHVALDGAAALGVGTSEVSWAPRLATPATVPTPLVGVPGGETGWLTDGVLAYQHLGGTPFIESIDVGTDVQTTLDAAGANDLAAGGGTWARWLAGVGYLDSFGHLDTNPDGWAPLAVDPSDGRVLVCTTRGAGSGVAIWDGVAVTPLYGGTLDLLDGAFRRGYATWRTGGTQWVWRAGAIVASLAVPLLAVTVDQGGWIVGWVTPLNGLYLIMPSSGWALLVSATGTDFNPAIDVVDAADEIYVATSLGAGELPAELQWYTIDPAASTVNGGARGWVNLLTGATSATFPGGTPVGPPVPGPTPAPGVSHRSILRPRRRTRVYPDVNQMTDRAAQQSVAKLWDRVQGQQRVIDETAARAAAAERRLRELAAEEED